MNEIYSALEGIKLEYKIELPRIVAIGSQSSGKSSVIESIVGVDFLPRGTGIVTRCPLVLKLVKNTSDVKVAIFSHQPERRFWNFAEVTQEILNRTNVLAGPEKPVVDQEISLEISSKDVPNLTLIDLPGFTRLEIDDQGEDVPKAIENLVMSYIKEKNTIILAISSANNDIANSDGLKYAKMVDPAKDRTFGVMTKIDIMDKGTDACKFLSGAEYKLKHGYIGVKCRSQEDNNNGKTIQVALEEEEKFFATHPSYSSFAETQGIKSLSKRLSELLQRHIIKQLPEIEQKIYQNLKNYSDILEDLGQGTDCNTEAEAFEYALKIISDYQKSYKDLIEHSKSEEYARAYVGGSRIYQIFRTFSKDKIPKVNPLKHITDEMILVEIRRSYGMEPGLFVPEEACKSLIRKHIDLFRKPIFECCEYVYEVLERGIKEAFGK